METQEIFARISEIAASLKNSEGQNACRMMHETLVMVCHEALKNSSHGYGNLFSQVDFLCRRHNVRLHDRVEIQTMRRHSNSALRIDTPELLYDLRVLSRFTAAVLRCGEPDFLLRALPSEHRKQPRTEGVSVNYVRCIVRGHDAEHLFVKAESGLDGKLLAVDCSAEHLLYIYNVARDGMQLNLLDGTLTPLSPCKTFEDETVEQCLHPGLAVVEPDFLLDISSVAACFKAYGHHPLNYVIDRFRPRANSQAILTGNLAGDVLDDIVNRGGGFSLAATLRSSFRERALEYCTCPGFNAETFKTDAKAQAANLQQAVSVLFDEPSLSGDGAAHDGSHTALRAAAVLEPSFICERLGLQGRVDLMTTDFRLLVEQKAGRNRNIDSGRPGQHGSLQLEPHYVQLLLYYGVLKYNFQVGKDMTDIRLLYSKYPPKQGLLAVSFYRSLFREAIALRNKIVALEFDIARKGFGSVLADLRPDTVNATGTSSSFYHQWLLPQIEAVTRPLQAMPPLERAYFCAMSTFVYREQLVARVGSQEGVSGCQADLWQMPLSVKRDIGNIYTDLRIERRESTKEGRGYDKIVLRVPAQGDDFMPNFRRGDMVYLYSYPEGGAPDVRQSLLFKGSLTDIHSEEITVTLADGQQNPAVLRPQPSADGLLYAVEHAGGDASTASSLRQLFEFITAPKSRRDLLLGRRAPERDPGKALSRSYDPAYDDILLRAKQASDYYLLVGPPGTGKTSMALRYLVEEELADPDGSVLLMAYTNRAVDEICSTLDAAAVDYIRLGSEHTADPRFSRRLLDAEAEACPQMAGMRERLRSVRALACTTSTLASRPFALSLRRFTLAIVDEASQILEPSVIGLLCSHRSGGAVPERCDIGRFILVGDYKQLPAVVQQDGSGSAVTDEALRAAGISDCRDSLFERLIRMERLAGRRENVGVLRKQGRMHPEVALYPSRSFYSEERLDVVPLPHQREERLNYLPSAEHDALDRLLRTRRTLFIAAEKDRLENPSDKANTAEARVAADVLRRLRAMTGAEFDPLRSVGVIVPYRNQIAVIRRELERQGLDELLAVTVDTVERYQGSQRDVIIYSFTVSRAYQLDFLTANCITENGRVIDRKLNVALTRARRQMIMIGSPAVLSLAPSFRQLIDFTSSRGGFYPAE